MFLFVCLPFNFKRIERSLEFEQGRDTLDDQAREDCGQDPPSGGVDGLDVRYKERNQGGCLLWDGGESC